jgi:hypothetical protein
MLTAEGEDFFDLVVQGNVDEQSAEAWGDRLRSDMADFVAESRLGWGQNRGVWWAENDRTLVPLSVSSLPMSRYALPTSPP